ncbi:MAG TPA: hypothetical protein H9881_07010 [Candidatus Stackebrandtia excrementipullorum]|nr:hypothetical protein [Candidatus Stackebrandtia excrementipullorum]
MLWTTIANRAQATTLARADRIRRYHRRVRRGLRQVCATCGNRWGAYGCSIYLWATDTLSRMSRIVVPNPPERPRYRHRPLYVRMLAEGAAQARRLSWTSDIAYE